MYKISMATLSSLAILLAACGSSSDGDSRVSLAITDAPVDAVDAVVVKFDSVILGTGANAQVFDVSETEAIDLLTLQGNRNQFLIEGVEIPAGEYRIRFGIDAIHTSCDNPTGEEASYVQVGDLRYPLAVPSGELKLNKSLTVAAGGLSSYTVDFDLRRALAARGETACYNINPTALRVVDNTEVGTLEGFVQSELMSNEACSGSDLVTGEGFAVYAFLDHGAEPLAGAELSSALLNPVADDAPGAFGYQLGFLAAGNYTAALGCLDEADGVVFLDQADVSISADVTTGQDFPDEAP